jgi:uncharacterized protein with beta-barrel porin domain
LSFLGGRALPNPLRKAATTRLGGPCLPAAPLFAAALVVLTVLAQPSRAQTTQPQPPPSSGFIDISASEAVFDLGTRFLRRLANSYAGGGTNPQGGGGPNVPTPQRYRAWTEGYGLTARTGAQDTFTGDKRSTGGLIGGIGAALAPELNVGFSVDQGWTKIDVQTLPQSARVDLTQIGGNAAYEIGNWTMAAALIYGFGTVSTSRFEFSRESSASYAAKMWGVLAELSYLHSIGSARIVPKVGFDWTQVETDAFLETGGILPVAGAATRTERARVSGGAELGYSWQNGQTLYDFSAYARLIGILSQDIGALQVSSAGLATAVQGIRENSPQVDTGASATVRLSPQLRVYGVYDAKFRSGYESHGGTLGAEFRW